MHIEIDIQDLVRAAADPAEGEHGGGEPSAGGPEPEPAEGEPGLTGAEPGAPRPAPFTAERVPVSVRTQEHTHSPNDVLLQGKLVPRKCNCTEKEIRFPYNTVL